jgi:hypothetical protein
MTENENKPFQMMAPTKAEYDQESFEVLRNQFEELLHDSEKFRAKLHQMNASIQEMRESGIDLDPNIFNANGGRIVFSVTQPSSIDNQPKLIIKRVL